MCVCMCVWVRTSASTIASQGRLCLQLYTAQHNIQITLGLSSILGLIFLSAIQYSRNWHIDTRSIGLWENVL